MSHSSPPADQPKANDQPANAGPIVACPQCQQPTHFAPNNPWRPFCSERCQRIDMGAWASEQFRIAGKPGDPQGSEQD
ncbi:DNA gyrase inhibitor YacG [Vandammella animalimorsus]|uniref:DNA gyrase inhibitor YacG n=1 Tax=Vandammella animalimorsus TaxID=2029117 RepID=A0A2A2AYH4_9BURK|nr:DNA gyrase inhibitor YacG [Vandammella animalimorsus]PAT32531.1 DNA gyrase inhibitor YacG [Vandammella animalimorsus]PAT42702.1 DNA gyrase inhibitor YacG [Vandammella animalimorsus]